MSVFLACAMICGLLVGVTALVYALIGGTNTAIQAVDERVKPTPKYRIVNPCNGENGTTVRTWAQIPYLWSIAIGEKVKIEATSSPPTNKMINFSTGYNCTPSNPPPTGINCTVITLKKPLGGAYAPDIISR